MKFRTFKQVLFVAVAFVVALFVTVASAMPETGKFQVVHRTEEDATKDSRPHVVVGPRVQVDQIVTAFAVMYKNATGKELTWQVIQAENAKNTIPVCKIPGDGPMWRGRGDTSVWENCPEEHRTVALIAGSSGVIRIPMHSVETYGQKMQRLQKQDACLKSVECMTKRLRELGAPAPKVEVNQKKADEKPSSTSIPEASSSVPVGPQRTPHAKRVDTDEKLKSVFTLDPPFAIIGVMMLLLGLVVSFKKGYAQGKTQGHKLGRERALEIGRLAGREDILAVVRELPTLNISFISGPIELDSLGSMQRAVVKSLPLKPREKSLAPKKDLETATQKIADLERKVEELEIEKKASARSADEQAVALRAKLADEKKALQEAKDAIANLAFELRQLQDELDALRSRPSVVVYGQSGILMSTDELVARLDDEDAFDGEETVVRERNDGAKSAQQEPASLARQIAEKDARIAELESEVRTARELVESSNEQARACVRAHSDVSTSLEHARQEIKSLSAQSNATDLRKLAKPGFDEALRLTERALRHGLGDTDNPLQLSLQGFTSLLYILGRKVEPSPELILTIPTETARNLIQVEDHYLSQLVEALAGYGAQPLRETQSFRPSIV
ncbi:MAG: hypothetical protein NUV81_00210 [bacterium]|nr:hypothetical protein [bacterium]